MRQTRQLLISQAFLIFLPSVQEFNWLVPNPDEPEPKKISLQIFLHNVQEIHWLGPKNLSKITAL